MNYILFTQTGEFSVRSYTSTTILYLHEEHDSRLAERFCAGASR